MSKDSKRRRQAIKRLLSKLYHIKPKGIEALISYADKIVRLPNGSPLPPEVTNIKSEMEDKAKEFGLRFDYLDWDNCVLKQFNEAKARALLEKFKYITSIQPNELPRSRIIRDNIPNKGEYKSLYRKLPSPDIDLKEIKFAGEGRIFCFIFEGNFYIVSIETEHRNID